MMEEKIIELQVNLADTGLGGFPTGERMWKEQVEEQFDPTKVNIIVFPNHIERVTSSFTQGFFKAIIKKIGFNGVENNVRIKARTEKLAESIMVDLYN